jgi:hypothetical protein
MAALQKEEGNIFSGGGGAVDGGRRKEVGQIYGGLLRSMIAERILDTSPTVGKCVELSRCVVSDSGVLNLRCVVLPHLVHPQVQHSSAWQQLIFM